MEEKWAWPFMIILSLIFFGETFFPVLKEKKEYLKHIIILLSIYFALSLLTLILYLTNIFPYLLTIFVLAVCWAYYVIPNIIRTIINKNKLFTKAALLIISLMTLISGIMFITIFIIE
jgi:hypothetical protein